MSCEKIVLIGPESTGKSYTSNVLTAHFNGVKVEEYAREFLLQLGRPYTYEDLATIAAGQLRLEDEGIAKCRSEKKPGPVFIDTDSYVIKVWSEFVFGKCNNAVLKTIAKRPYDLYLLCSPDLPWVKDELREYPDQATRDILFQHYKELLSSQHVPWVIIHGDYEARITQAIAAVASIT